MLSRRLIETVQNHADELGERLALAIRSHPNTRTYRKLSDAEILLMTRPTYRNLGAWLEGQSSELLNQRYEQLGKTRWEEGIPLEQLIYALIIAKDNLFGFVQARGWGGLTVEMYAAQELLGRVMHFFDDATYHALKGYLKAAGIDAGSKKNVSGVRSRGASLGDLERFCP